MFRLVPIAVLVVLLSPARAIEKRLLFTVADGVDVGSIADPDIIEASGLCASRKNHDILFTHNDFDHRSGENKIFALNKTTAQVISTITINGATNNDWEDIACGPCFGHTNDWCIYIGDTGHVAGNDAVNIIYMVKEPDSYTATMSRLVDKKLQFSWEEEDAETLMVDPQAHVYVISKANLGRGLVAKIPDGAWSSPTPVYLTNSIHLSHVSSERDPVGGDISPDGKEVLIKNRREILHYHVSGSQTIIQALSGKPFIMPYTIERKGQAICFSADGKSYYTLGEGVHEHLWRYDSSIVQ